MLVGKKVSKMNEMTIIVQLRRTAKIWSLISLGFVTVFLVGSALNPSEPLPALVEWGELVLFPTGVLTGLLLAWKYEWIGALASILSLGAFYVVEWNLKGRIPHGPFFLLLTVPAFLFLACHICTVLRKKREG